MSKAKKKGRSRKRRIEEYILVLFHSDRSALRIKFLLLLVAQLLLFSKSQELIVLLFKQLQGHLETMHPILNLDIDRPIFSMIHHFFDKASRD